jgi:hypothetical protein
MVILTQGEGRGSSRLSARVVAGCRTRSSFHVCSGDARSSSGAAGSDGGFTGFRDLDLYST